MKKLKIALLLFVGSLFCIHLACSSSPTSPGGSGGSSATATPTTTSTTTPTSTPLRYFIDFVVSSSNAPTTTASMTYRIDGYVGSGSSTITYSNLGMSVTMPYDSSFGAGVTSYPGANVEVDGIAPSGVSITVDIYKTLLGNPTSPTPWLTGTGLGGVSVIGVVP